MIVKDLMILVVYEAKNITNEFVCAKTILFNDDRR